MFDAFEIIETRPGWYQLIFTDTMQVVSCGGDLESIFRVLRKYIYKFKTRQGIKNALAENFANSPIGAIVFERTKRLIQETAQQFEERKDSEISEVLDKIKSEKTGKVKLKLIPVRTDSGYEKEKLVEVPSPVGREESEIKKPNLIVPKIKKVRLLSGVEQ